MRKQKVTRGNKIKLLDLFCGAGGAAMGYYRAGFTDITGVDNRPMPRYPFKFIQADALEYLEKHSHEYDVIHASPPCQAFTNARVIHGKLHPDLLTPTRRLLEKAERVWIIENVPGSPMRKDIVVCGSRLGLKRLIRHRYFEINIEIFDLLPPCNHGKETISVFGHGGHIYHTLAEWKEVMGIDWMVKEELAQAIPPAYTEWIGRRIMEAINDP